MKNWILIYSFFTLFAAEIHSQWTPLPNAGINNYLINCYFISADTGWIVGRGPALFKTIDGGNTWISQQTLTNEDLLSVYFLDGMLGWVTGYDGGIYKTSDGGLTWALKPSGTNYAIREIKFCDPLTGFAIVSNWVSPRYGAIIQTTNGGDSWFPKVIINDYAFLDLDFFDCQNGWAAGTNGLFYRTTNGGNTWLGPQFITDFWIHEIDFPNVNIGYAIGGGYQNDIILKTNNGGQTWSVIRKSYSNPQLLGASFLSSELGWVVGMGGTILMTTNGGVNWIRQETNVPSLFHDVFMVDSTGYAVGELGKIYKYDSNYQYPLTVTRPNGGEIFYSGTHESINWIWSDTSNVTIEYSYGTGWNTIVTNYPNTGEFLWTVPNVNTNQALVKISKADDSGIYDMSNYPFSIRPFIPVELVSFNADVWSGNVTLSWSTASEVNNFGFEVQRSIDNTDFLTIGFVNGYGTTTELNDYTYTDQNVTPGKYYYRLKQVDFDGTFEYSNIVEAEVVGPVDFSLNQNYPNPFNPSTVISFSIPVSDYVTIKIYDMLGNEVGVIVNEELPAGTHTAEFEIEGISSGTYFYRIQAGSYSDTKKMIFLK
jgi:photosystem II stability/assembly factor-like uncharacterized protein